MRIIELYRTTGFRLALSFLALFGLTSVVLYTFIDIEVKDFLTEKVDDWVLREGRSLTKLNVQTIAARLDNRKNGEFDAERPMTLFNAAHERLAGSPIPFPMGYDGATTPFEFGADSGMPGVPFRGLTWTLPGGEILLVAESISEVKEFNEVLFGAMLLAGGCTALFGLAGAVLIGTGAVRHFDAVTQATRKIVAGDLSGRLPSQGVGGDTGRLIAVVNEMLDEIERLMREVKGVCDNIAHDLRTPLTRLLAGLDRARRRATNVEDYANSVDEAIVETQGILKTFAALLRISEVEDGARRAGFVPVDLAAIVADAIELYEPLAEEKEINLTSSIQESDPRPLPGDPSLLFEAVANLIDNALKFSPKGGNVEVHLERKGDLTRLRVTDDGPGIPEADRANVLRRFYRAEPSRHAPGNGLGLSLVAAIARLHGIKLDIAGGTGTTVTLEHNAASASSLG